MQRIIVETSQHLDGAENQEACRKIRGKDHSRSEKVPSSTGRTEEEDRKTSESSKQAQPPPPHS